MTRKEPVFSEATKTECLRFHLRTLNPAPPKSGAPWLLVVVLAAFALGIAI